MGTRGLVAGVGLALVVLGLPTAAQADRPEALKDFNQGKQYQASRQWRQAIQCYSAALKTDPSFYYSYKALGTVYYQAGDHRGALAYYDLYLKSAPGDAATQAFAEKIRAELGGARRPVAEATPTSAPGTPSAQPGGQAAQTLHAGFDVRAFGLGVMDSGSDLVADFPGISASSCFATGGGLGLDYGLGVGFVAGLDLMTGPNRSQGLSAGTSSATATVSNLCGFVNAGWRFPLFRDFVLEPRLGLGFVSGTLAIAGLDSSSGSGFGVWPELRGEYEAGNWGLGLSLGYLISSIPTLTDSTTGQADVVQNNNVTLQTGGPSVDLFVVYHFDPLLQ